MHNNPRFITRQYIRANRDTLFIFGDNLLGMGFGGQAKEMRGEPNAFGVPTKKKPSNTSDSFFTDDEYEKNIKAIDLAISVIPKDGRKIIVPAGIGTGLADLPTKAPKTYQYLASKLLELEFKGED